MTPGERRAPVQGDYQPPGTRGREPGTISWAEHLEAYEVYAKENGRDQSAERVADRDGFAYSELVTLLGRPPSSWTSNEPAAGTRVYFFGCASVPEDHHSGHFLYAPGRSAVGVRMSSIYGDVATPWTLAELDGGLLRAGRRPYEPGDEPQGQALLQHRAGWTLLTLWDRTGDQRGGCVSGLVAEGELDFEQMTALFAATFAVLWARITAAGPVTSHPNNPAPPAKQRIAPAALRFPAFSAASGTPPTRARPTDEAPADELPEPAAALPPEARRLLLEGPR